jgi:hypothetical protein
MKNAYKRGSHTHEKRQHKSRSNWTEMLTGCWEGAEVEVMFFAVLLGLFFFAAGSTGKHFFFDPLIGVTVNAVSGGGIGGVVGAIYGLIRFLTQSRPG